MKVLISPGYGAGWSTWNYTNMAFDEALIAAFEGGISEAGMKDLCERLGYGNPYTSGFKGLKVVTVPPQTFFRITEYDGNESIEILDIESDWIWSGDE